MAGGFPEEVLQQIETCRETALAIEKYIGAAPRVDGRFGNAPSTTATGEIPAENYEFARMPEYIKLKQTQAMLVGHGRAEPLFQRA